MNYLFENFMVDEKIFQQNQTFLANLISEISEKELSEYYNIKFSKSEDVHEGCPIFIARYNWRTLRIIQRPSQSNRPIIFANLDEPKQLTVEMELSKEVLPTFKLYIRMWLVEQISKQGMNAVLDFTANLKNEPTENIMASELKSFQYIERNNFGKLEVEDTSAFSEEHLESVFD